METRIRYILNLLSWLVMQKLDDDLRKKMIHDPIDGIDPEKDPWAYVEEIIMQGKVGGIRWDE